MNRKKLTAGTLAVVMITGSTLLPAVNVSAAENTSSKEEVIYIITDASGAVDSVNAVNIFGKGSVTDYGDYSSVKMLNTTDDITLDGNKVTFTTDSDKAYYQGTMEDAQVPWTITFTYTLDGKTITPDDLAGKSGALKIHISIQKNNKCTSDFYDSYALQAALTLDTEKCENITADGATLANVGSDKQISYTVLPGKGLGADITADVTDFEMDAVSINAIKLNLNLDIDDEELMDKVTDIMDAAKDMHDGASALSDGADALTEGGSSLSDGAASLQSGAASLDSGLQSLNGGVTSMQSALNTLNAQSSNLTGGSAQMSEALKTIQSELSNVSVSTEQLSQLTASSAAIKQGISDAYDGALALQTSLSYDAYKATMSANGLDIDTLQAGNTEAIATLSTQIQDLSASLAQLKSIPDYESNPTYAAQVAQLESQIASLTNIVTLLTGNNAAIDGTSQYLTATSSGVSELVTGLETLKTNYEAFDAAIVSLTDTLSNLAVNVSSLKTAIDTLVTNYETLDSGTNAYTNGVASIVAAYSQIVDGTGTLANGSKTLADGSLTLKQGTKELYDGLVSLDNGAGELSDGTKEFYEQTDGMDTKIQDTLDEMIDSISGGDSEPVSFTSDKNTNVTAVQFVIKTAAIEKEEEAVQTETETKKLNFWEKLLNLFGL